MVLHLPASVHRYLLDNGLNTQALHCVGLDIPVCLILIQTCVEPYVLYNYTPVHPLRLCIQKRSKRRPFRSGRRNKRESQAVPVLGSSPLGSSASRPIPVRVSSTRISSFEAVEVHTNLHQPVCLTCIYLPSKKNKLTNRMFLTDFQDLLDVHLSKRCQHVLVGDFNLHFDTSSDGDVRAVYSMLADHHLQQLITEATYRRGHILDWLITREDSDLLYKVNVSDFDFSDHKTVFFDLKLVRPQRPKRTVTSRNLRQINIEVFHTDMKTIIGTVLTDCGEDQLLDSYISSF
ncbi:hypothetical protein BaRGS_00002249 [Batillaria attramentaria]|uniref:Endonuclease/exonuclease/phosphatase domain-containing protein n=1 Tax=Batillaria attramentaria TaxID=370345 RepID=A0ABD0M4L0_9CAEN